MATTREQSINGKTYIVTEWPDGGRVESLKDCGRPAAEEEGSTLSERLLAIEKKLDSLIATMEKP